MGVKIVVVLLLVAVVAVVLIKLRQDASKARHEVMMRLSDEAEAKGVVSPTEELFRAEGVPVSDELRQSLVTAPPAAPAPSKPAPPLRSDPEVAPDDAESSDVSPTPAAGGDLADLFEGIEMPCDLAPLTMTAAPGVNCAVATFVTDEGQRPVLAANLGQELTRIGCVVTWLDGSTAKVERGDDTADITIYDQPDQVKDADGTQAFPTTTTRQVVVKLTAT